MVRGRAEQDAARAGEIHPLEIEGSKQLETWSTKGSQHMAALAQLEAEGTNIPACMGLGVKVQMAPAVSMVPEVKAVDQLPQLEAVLASHGLAWTCAPYDIS